MPNFDAKFWGGGKQDVLRNAQVANGVIGTKSIF